MSFSNLRIVHKLLVLVGALSLATAAVSGVGVFGIRSLSEAATSIERAGGQSLAASRINQSVVALNRAEFRIAADPSAENMAEALRTIEQQRKALASGVEELRAARDETTRRLLQEAEAKYATYSRALETMIETARRNQDKIALDAAQKEIRDAALASRAAASEVTAGFRAVADYTDRKAEQITNAASDSAARIELIMFGVAGLGVVGGLAIGYAMARFGVAAPLVRSVAGLRRLAEGQTEIDIYGLGRRDEIGDIAGTMQVFRDNIVRNREMERAAREAEQRAAEERRRAMLTLADRFDSQVGGVVDTLGNAATGLQATAQQLAAAVEETSRQSTAVAVSATQASANVQTVASAAEELSAAIREVSGQVAETANRSRSTTEHARTAQARLDGLAAAVGQVAEIVNAISDVASQTNLLALNATIEAARAGEAGKGFAVVASEVKSLANQTRAMTDRIREQMAAVQGASEATVAAMRGIIGQVEEIDHAAAGMASAVEQQSAATVEISRNAQQAATGTEEVTGSISGVRTAAEQTGQASVSVRDSASDLAGQAAELRAAVRSFLAEVRAA
ncbi:methyl-accepting chemotaxis protein [Arenibaculum pallidiluteum]|uniref:methyl-accepting chemotaxis protein n=1 Tax=Arenibaculum pallidiluteum TaxID=2812559 RepID=UPI001A97CAB8|nr:methyl-accepting chemotaxis protein [Arenibaculum pallidiluteum]